MELEAPLHTCKHKENQETKTKNRVNTPASIILSSSLCLCLSLSLSLSSPAGSCWFVPLNNHSSQLVKNRTSNQEINAVYCMSPSLTRQEGNLLSPKQQQFHRTWGKINLSQWTYWDCIDIELVVTSSMLIPFTGSIFIKPTERQLSLYVKMADL